MADFQTTYRNALERVGKSFKTLRVDSVYPAYISWSTQTAMYLCSCSSCGATKINRTFKELNQKVNCPSCEVRKRNAPKKQVVEVKKPANDQAKDKYAIYRELENLFMEAA